MHIINREIVSKLSWNFTQNRNKMKKTIGLIVAMDKELSLFIDNNPSINNPSVSVESKSGCFDFFYNAYGW